MLAPFSAQVGPGTVFEPSYLRKSDCSRNITFSNTFGPKWTPRWGQDRPKIAPRRVQDRLGSPFFHLEFSLRFLIVLGSVLVPFWPPKWSPWGDWKLGVPPPLGDRRRSWDRLGSVLFSSCRSGSLFWASWVPLGVVLGDLWPRFGPSWARFGALRVSFWNPITLYAHQFVNASTLQPVARQHFVTRAGGLRAERLNNTTVLTRSPG